MVRLFATFLWLVFPLEGAAKEGALILGDSHLYGNFGQTLHESIKQKTNLDVTSISVCPATPETFTKRQLRSLCGLRVRKSSQFNPRVTTTLKKVKWTLPSLRTQISRINPKLVVIALGTNMSRASESRISRSVKNLTGLVRQTKKNVSIVWIGPPFYQGSMRVNNIIEKAIKKYSPNTFFLHGTEFNRHKPLPRRNPHFGPRKAGLWAKYLTAKMPYNVLNPKRPKLVAYKPPPPDPCGKTVKGYKIPSVKFVGINSLKQRGKKIKFKVQRSSLSCKQF